MDGCAEGCLLLSARKNTFINLCRLFVIFCFRSTYFCVWFYVFYPFSEYFSFMFMLSCSSNHVFVSTANSMLRTDIKL